LAIDSAKARSAFATASASDRFEVCPRAVPHQHSAAALNNPVIQLRRVIGVLPGIVIDAIFAETGQVVTEIGDFGNW
jgi:hypothetical protein